MFVKYLLEGIKTVIVAVIVSFLLILACAGICKIFSLSTNWVNVMNMIVKALSIIISILICFKYSTYGWLRGGLSGLVYVLLSSAIFALITKDSLFNAGFLADVLLGVVAGIVAGAFVVNVKRTTTI